MVSRQGQHEEASALLGSAGLEATEPVRKQHSRGFVLPGWPAVELLKYKVRPETNHQVNQWKGTAYVQLTIEWLVEDDGSSVVPVPVSEFGAAVSERRVHLLGRTPPARTAPLRVTI